MVQPIGSLYMFWDMFKVILIVAVVDDDDDCNDDDCNDDDDDDDDGGGNDDDDDCNDDDDDENDFVDARASVACFIVDNFFPIWFFGISSDYSVI